MLQLRLLLVICLTTPAFMACGDDDDDDDDDDIGGGDGDADSDADGDADVACDVYAQSGCDYGENCTFNADVKECSAAGAGGQDDACDAANLCGVGFVCLADNTCAAFCNGGVTCPRGALCTVGLQAAGAQAGDPFLATVCSTPSNCDALAQDGCGAGSACYIVSPNDGATDCAGEGALATGDACINLNSCRAGATCLNTGGANSYCLEHCDTAANTCPQGQACAALVAGGQLGLCVPAD